MPTLFDLEQSRTLYVRAAAFKKMGGFALTANEERRIQGLMNAVHSAPLTSRYRALGGQPKLLSERIHTVQEDQGPLGAGGSNSGKIYTFSACVNGVPKSFDIRIVRGPY